MQSQRRCAGALARWRTRHTPPSRGRPASVGCRIGSPAATLRPVRCTGPACSRTGRCSGTNCLRAAWDSRVGSTTPLGTAAHTGLARARGSATGPRSDVLLSAQTSAARRPRRAKQAVQVGDLDADPFAERVLEQRGGAHCGELPEVPCAKEVHAAERPLVRGVSALPGALLAGRFCQPLLQDGQDL